MASETSGTTRIRVHGHRGARARFPENTLPGFEYAIRLGVDALEMDMAVTKDNVIVISHDPILHGPICTGPQDAAIIRELTLAEVQQWDCGGTRMPALDDAFQLAASGNFDYHLETKSYPGQPQYTPPPEEFARMVLERIRLYKLERRVVLLSFDFRTLVAMRSLAPEIRRSALTETDTRDFRVIAREGGEAEIISPEFHLVTPGQVTAAHAAGLEVVPWTANTPQDWEMLIEAKVDAIVTDAPAELMAYLKNR